MESGTTIDARSLLVLTPEGQEYHYILNTAEVLIGHDPQCTIRLVRRGVSRRHARLRIETDRATAQDLGSTNGTRLNGTPLLAEPVNLEDGDCLTICGVEIRYVDPSARARVGESPVDDEQFVTQMTTLLTKTGGLGTLMAGTPSLLDSPEAEASILRVVLSRPPGPRLMVREAGTTREIVLDQREVLIGRGTECRVCLTDRTASKRHATIRTAGDDFVIEDLDSSNGFRVNGIPVREHRLIDGDLVRIGGATLSYSATPPKLSSRVSGGETRPHPVIIIPGFAASELWKGDVKIWPNCARLLSTPEPRLHKDWEDLTVGQIAREITILPGFAKHDSFGSLLRYLTEELGYEPNRDVLEFPYDWRQDNRTTAHRLAKTVRAWRERRGRATEKVIIVAHSMGGLVARLFLSAYGGSDAVRRSIFLGTPHFGSPKSLALAIAGSGMLPFGVSLKKVQKLLSGFPAFLQLLPTYPAARLPDGRPFLPLEEDHDWLEPAYRPLLEGAAAFRELVDARRVTDLVPTTCIYGYQQRTLDSIQLQRDRSGALAIESMRYAKSGDGTVPEKSAALDHADIHPVVQQHGALHSDRDVLRRLRFELIERGDRDTGSGP